VAYPMGMCNSNSWKSTAQLEPSWFGIGRGPVVYLLQTFGSIAEASVQNNVKVNQSEH
jgi:hypothetical protein